MSASHSEVINQLRTIEERWTRLQSLALASAVMPSFARNAGNPGAPSVENVRPVKLHSVLDDLHFTASTELCALDALALANSDSS